MDENIYSPPQADMRQGPGSFPHTYGRLDLSSAVNVGMESLMANFGLCTLAGIVYLALVGVFTILAFLVIGMFLLPVLQAGLEYYGIQMARRKAVVEDLFHGFSFFGRVLGAGILKGLISFAVILPFYAPFFTLYFIMMKGLTDTSHPNNAAEMLGNAYGIIGMLAAYGFLFLGFPVVLYIQGRLMLVDALIMLRQERVMEAMSNSWKATRKQHFMVLLFTLIKYLFAQIGIILCCVGITWSITAASAMQGAATLQMLGQGDEIPPPGKSNTQGQDQPPPPPDTGVAPRPSHNPYG